MLTKKYDDFTCFWKKGWDQAGRPACHGWYNRNRRVRGFIFSEKRESVKQCKGTRLTCATHLFNLNDITKQQSIISAVTDHWLFIPRARFVVSNYVSFKCYSLLPLRFVSSRPSESFVWWFWNNWIRCYWCVIGISSLHRSFHCFLLVARAKCLPNGCQRKKCRKL